MTFEHPPVPCTICHRAGGGIAFRAPGLRVNFCSFECSEVYMMARAKKIDLTLDEKAATIAGGKGAGAFLEGIGKTDLAEMTRDEWEGFCAELVRGYVADLQRQADSVIPY
jgi:hypothetical protein